MTMDILFLENMPMMVDSFILWIFGSWMSILEITLGSYVFLFMHFMLLFEGSSITEVVEGGGLEGKP